MKHLSKNEISDFLLECSLMYSHSRHDYRIYWPSLEKLKKERPLNLEAGHWRGEIVSELYGGQFLVCRDHYFDRVGYSVYRVTRQGWLIRAGMDRCATMTLEQAIHLASSLGEIYKEK